jgi:hypothetical protein
VPRQPNFNSPSATHQSDNTIIPNNSNQTNQDYTNNTSVLPTNCTIANRIQSLLSTINNQPPARFDIIHQKFFRSHTTNLTITLINREANKINQPSSDYSVLERALFRQIHETVTTVLSSHPSDPNDPYHEHSQFINLFNVNISPTQKANFPVSLYNIISFLTFNNTCHHYRQ